MVSGATHQMQVTVDEIFGPLVPIFKFDTEDEVVRLRNSTELGLAGYFVSRDVSGVMRVAQKL